VSRRPSAFRQRDVTRAVKAVQAAGVEVSKVEIAVDGRIIIGTAKAQADQTNDHGGAVPADLDRELVEFEARHGQG
jgi:hypothetical protein